MSLENRDLYFGKTAVVDTESIDSDAKSKKRTRGLGWSLGWGKYTPRGGYVTFHGGKGDGYENFVSIYTMPIYNCVRAIVVLSATSEDSPTFMGRVIEAMIGDTFAPLEWMGFK